MMAVCLTAICSMNDKAPRAKVFNSVVDYFKDHKDDIGIDVGIDSTFPRFCVSNESNCLDLDTNFCNDTDGILSLSGHMAGIGAALVLLQMHFTLVARGNMSSLLHKSPEA